MDIENNKITIIVKTMSSSQHELSVDCSLKIYDLKLLIEKVSHIDVLCQRLIFKGKELGNDAIIKDSLTDKDIIFLMKHINKNNNKKEELKREPNQKYLDLNLNKVIPLAKQDMIDKYSNKFKSTNSINNNQNNSIYLNQWLSNYKEALKLSSSYNERLLETYNSLKTNILYKEENDTSLIQDKQQMVSLLGDYIINIDNFTKITNETNNLIKENLVPIYNNLKKDYNWKNIQNQNNKLDNQNIVDTKSNILNNMSNTIIKKDSIKDINEINYNCDLSIIKEIALIDKNKEYPVNKQLSSFYLKTNSKI